MEIKPFHHNFQEPRSIEDFKEIYGFILGMRSLLTRIQEMTEFKPEKRYIDACELLEAIPATTVELEKLLEAYKMKLSSSVQPEYMGD